MHSSHFYHSPLHAARSAPCSLSTDWIFPYQNHPYTGLTLYFHGTFVPGGRELGNQLAEAGIGPPPLGTEQEPTIAGWSILSQGQELSSCNVYSPALWGHPGRSRSLFYMTAFQIYDGGRISFATD